MIKLWLKCVYGAQSSDSNLDTSFQAVHQASSSCDDDPLSGSALPHAPSYPIDCLAISNSRTSKGGSWWQPTSSAEGWTLSESILCSTTTCQKILTPICTGWGLFLLLRRSVLGCFVFWHINLLVKKNPQVLIIKSMMAEFHLPASVSGSWCVYMLPVTLFHLNGAIDSTRMLIQSLNVCCTTT